MAVTYNTMGKRLQAINPKPIGARPGEYQALRDGVQGIHDVDTISKRECIFHETDQDEIHVLDWLPQ